MLPKEISKNVITQVSVGREYWIRDENDKDRYYFIDFCIPNKIAVEFHGNAFHPKYNNDVAYRVHLLGGLPVSEKFEYDRRKAKSIEKSGMKLLEVWDDVKNYNEIVNWIKEKYYE